MEFTMLNCSTIILCGRIATVLFLVICTGLTGTVLAAGARSDKVVNSKNTIGSYSESGQQARTGKEVITSTEEAGKNEHRLKRPAYRSARSIDASSALADFTQLPAGFCGVVERIDPITFSSANNNTADTLIPGTVAIPFGKHGGSFFTEVDVPGNSGYVPPERNIPEPAYYRISLLANDGNRYVITQQVLPGVQLGETIRFNKDGSLERGDCVMRESWKINPNK